MFVRICKKCGNKFETTSNRQVYCKKQKIKICPVCGKQFFTMCCGEEANTCSKNCSNKYAAMMRERKAKETTRICKWCGKEFHPKSKRDEYCYELHYKICEVCGKQFVIDVRRHPEVKTCSKECRYKLAQTNTDIEKRTESHKKTLLEKYDVDNVMKIPGISDKIKQTNSERYGKEWYTQTDSYRKSVKETSQEKYGTDHFLSSRNVMEKRKQTCLDKYGVDNVSKSNEVVNHIKEVLMDRYGVENIGQVHVKNLDEWKIFRKNPISYIKSHFDKPTMKELCDYFGVTPSPIYNLIDIEKNPKLLKHEVSIMESDVKNLLDKYQIECSQNKRTVISPYELDFYLPKHHIAIECNPTATHNSSKSDPWNGEAKDHRYHQMKTDLCEKQGIFLFHIFGWEWTNKREIIESMLRNLLGVYEQKIYARNCELREVSYNDAVMFLNENHRQGNSSSSVRLGLYYENELVSLMTFSKRRATIGSESDGEYELVRFCNKLNTQIVGGASKLFKHFVNILNPSSVMSFSDRAHTRGHLYEVLGFQEVRRSEPGYVWVNEKTDIAYNRVNTQKHNLKKFLKDDSIDLSQTETQIMESHGFLKVYDSGTVTWKWSR